MHLAGQVHALLLMHILFSPPLSLPFPHIHTHSHTHVPFLYTCRQDDIKRRHEVARTPVGSRWVWLEHRMAELNKQICRLDNIMQRRPGRENFVFAAPSSSACVCSIPNGALANGGLLSMTGLHHNKGRIVNGFNHHTSSTPSFTPLLLADSVLGSRLQVRHRETERGGEVPS